MRTTRPVFYITLRNVVDELPIYAQYWNVLEIENGVCKVLLPSG